MILGRVWMWAVCLPGSHATLWSDVRVFEWITVANLWVLCQPCGDNYTWWDINILWFFLFCGVFSLFGAEKNFCWFVSLIVNCCYYEEICLDILIWKFVDLFTRQVLNLCFTRMTNSNLTPKFYSKKTLMI